VKEASSADQRETGKKSGKEALKFVRLSDSGLNEERLWRISGEGRRKNWKRRGKRLKRKIGMDDE
jgi:hypothetical protein